MGDDPVSQHEFADEYRVAMEELDEAFDAMLSSLRLLQAKSE
jgi:hypothetical protein